MSAVKRCMADIAELQKEIYTSQGIYYSADENDCKQGYACVFGPEGTPYEDCPMLYHFEIPSTFPFDPPKVLFRTYDGQTRFHPNMYKDGKCCLSILHTWEGPKWASTMRLSTVLITLQSLMDTEPLLHEPGCPDAKGPKGKEYAQFVEHSCMRYILERAEKKPLDIFKPFVTFFNDRLGGILERLEKRIQKRLEEGEKVFPSLPYSMSGKTEYAKLLERVKNALKLRP
jgi:ubiquitin-protein ligase